MVNRVRPRRLRSVAKLKPKRVSARLSRIKVLKRVKRRSPKRIGVGAGKLRKRRAIGRPAIVRKRVVIGRPTRPKRKSSRMKQLSAIRRRSTR